jgi:hypothetical protein
MAKSRDARVTRAWRATATNTQQYRTRDGHRSGPPVWQKSFISDKQGTRSTSVHPSPYRHSNDLPDRRAPSVHGRMDRFRRGRGISVHGDGSGPQRARRRRRESSLDRGRGLKARHSTRGRFLVLGHMQADDGPRQLAKLVPVPERSHHWHNGAGSCWSVRASPAPARLSVSSSIGGCACAARNRDRLGGLNRR